MLHLNLFEVNVEPKNERNVSDWLTDEADLLPPQTWDSTSVATDGNKLLTLAHLAASNDSQGASLFCSVTLSAIDNARCSFQRTKAEL